MSVPKSQRAPSSMQYLETGRAIYKECMKLAAGLPDARYHRRVARRHAQRRILEKCAELEIPVNMQKTRISKLRRFRFLKISYSLTETGAVVRRPNKKAFKRMRDRLRVFRRWVTAGRMEFRDVLASLASWTGCMNRSRAYFGVRRVIALFYTLFKEEIGLCSTLPKTVRLSQPLTSWPLSVGRTTA